MNNDAEQLRAYAETGSETAFAALVERHKGLVYASALRQTGEAGLAEEITQTVFIVLSRKAGKLKSGTLLSGWLFRATRFAACDALKIERRRLRREHQASLMNPNDAASHSEEAAWQEIAPVLDESLARLGEADRHALLLRFFEKRKLADVGHALGLSEDGARKRVARALEKLRGLLGQRGVVVPVAVLTTALAANAAPAAPVTLTISTAAAATTPLLKGTLALMAWSKTKIAVVTITAFVLLNGGVITTVLFVQHQRDRPAEASATPVTTNEFSKEELVVTAFVPPAADREGFISLFNGRDLTGWNYNPHVWSVVDGVITARAPADSRQTVHYLAWAGGEVQNFELRLKVRTTANDNSGVALRARWPQQRWMPGYQAEIHGQRSGLLVIAGAGNERQLSRAGWFSTAREENGVDVLVPGETLPDATGIDTARRAVERGDWCDFTVIAHDRHFIIRLNGVTVTDSRDEHPTKSVPSGMLGLEYSHKIGTEDAVEFKDIRFKQLTTETTENNGGQ